MDTGKGEVGKGQLGTPAPTLPELQCSLEVSVLFSFAQRLTKEASFSQKSPSLAAVSQETYLQAPGVISMTISSMIILSMIIHHTCPEAGEKLAEEK